MSISLVSFSSYSKQNNQVLAVCFIPYLRIFVLSAMSCYKNQKDGTNWCHTIASFQIRIIRERKIANDSVTLLIFPLYCQVLDRSAWSNTEAVRFKCVRVETFTTICATSLFTVLQASYSFRSYWYHSESVFSLCRNNSRILGTT